MEVAPEQAGYRRAFWALGQAITAIGVIAFVIRFGEVGVGRVATDFFVWWDEQVDRSLGAALRLVCAPIGITPPNWLADLMLMSTVGAYFWRESVLLHRPVWLGEPGGDARYRRLRGWFTGYSFLLGLTGFGIFYFAYPLAALFEVLCYPSMARDVFEVMRGRRAYDANGFIMAFRLRIWAGAALAVAVFFAINAYV